MGAAELAAHGPDGDQARDLTLQQLADRRAVGSVLDQDSIWCQSLLAEFAEGLGQELDDSWQIQALVLAPQHRDGSTPWLIDHRPGFLRLASGC